VARLQRRAKSGNQGLLLRLRLTAHLQVTVIMSTIIRSDYNVDCIIVRIEWAELIALVDVQVLKVPILRVPD